MTNSAKRSICCLTDFHPIEKQAMSGGITGQVLILIIEYDTLSASFWWKAMLLTTIVYAFGLLTFKNQFRCFQIKLIKFLCV